MPKTVVLVVLDSLRYDIFQRYLATGGDGFIASLPATQYHGATATAPWSLPSHASIFTGEYPREHGALRSTHTIHRDNRTLLDELAAEGFDQACFTSNPFVDPGYGFDGWEEHRNHYMESVYPDATIPRSERTGVGQLRDGLKQIASADDRYRALGNAVYRKLRTSPALVDDGGRRMTRDAVHWLSGRGDTDCFLFLNYMETHDYHKKLVGYRNRVSDVVQDEELKRLNRLFGGQGISHYFRENQFSDADRECIAAIVSDELTYVDTLLERLWNQLVQSGRADDALLLLCSDHGDAFGERGFVYHLAGVTEPLVRVPLLVHSPGQTESRSINERVSLAWLHDTVLNYAGQNRPVDLREPGSYPETLGAENTDRLADLLGGFEGTVRDGFRQKRTAVYDRTRPESKYVRIGDEVQVRQVERRGLREVDVGSDDEERIEAFERGLTEREPQTRSLDAGAEDRLRDLGYIE